MKGSKFKIHSSLNHAIQSIFDTETSVIRRIPVSGGDINRAFLLMLSNGEQVFMKENSASKLDMFKAEALGLAAIHKTETIRTPEVLAIGTDAGASIPKQTYNEIKDLDYGTDPGSQSAPNESPVFDSRTNAATSFLILEYIHAGHARRSSSELLGHGLAHMHLSRTEEFVNSGKYGFLQDNYIGSNVQINTPKDSWVKFFAECRLLPQIQMAASYFDTSSRKKFDRLIERLDHFLVEPEHPALLHGDLWSGNYMIDSDGAPWLIDPAAYVGHPESDLAMTELFGGFDWTFYEAYRNTAGIDSGYRSRRDLYNLYHLLNHLNLFGSGYLNSVLTILSRYS